MNPPQRRLVGFLYSLAVGLGGWAVIGLACLKARQPYPAAAIILFILLSAGTKRLGVQVATDVTHSLVGVIDLAALLSLGIPGGGLVASASSALCRLICPGERPRRPWTDKLLLALFGSGLNGWMVAAAGTCYTALGGGLPLFEITWEGLPALLSACVAWFVVDHLGWCVAEGIRHGYAGMMRFLRRILPYSLVIELAPLPAAVIVSAAYHSPSSALLILTLLVILTVGLVLRKLLLSLDEERRHVRELATLGGLSQALLSARLDLEEICGLLHHYCSQMVEAPTFVLQLRGQQSGEISTPLVAVDGQVLPAAHPPGEGALRWLAAHGQPLRLEDGPAEAWPFPPLAVGAPPRSALYVPIAMDGELLGVISLQSPQPHAFTAEDEQALVRLASQAALGLHTARLYRQEQERAAQLVAIAAVSRKVASILDLQTLLADAVTLVQETFGYYHVAIFTVSAERQEVVFQASSSPLIQARGVTIPWNQGIVGRAAASGRSVLVSDVRQEPDFVPDARLAETRAELAMPLRVEQRVLGVLDLQSDRPGAFSEQDVAVLQILADQIAIAIEDSRLYQAQQEQAWVSTALLQVAEAVAQLTTAEEILATTTRLTPMLTGVDRCLIFLWSEEERAFIVAEVAGLPREQAAAVRQQRFAADQLPLLLRVREGGAILQGPAEELTRYLPPPLAAFPPQGEYMALPLRAKGQVLGALVTLEMEGNRRLATHRRTILTGIANYAAMAIENARLYQQTLQQERLRREIELAQEIQQSFLPDRCPHFPGWDLVVEWRAARGIGGDFYDFIRLDAQHLGLVIADVSDKGVAAALYMALSRTVMRTVALGTLGVAQVLRRVNQVLLEDSASGMFVSMFYGVLNLETGLLTYARAGHNPPLWVWAAEGRIVPLSPPGTILGVLEDPELVEETIQLQVGDVLVAYTDGVIEAINEQDEEFGEERLRSLLQRATEQDAETLVNLIDAALRVFTGDCPQFDDITLMVVKRLPLAQG